MTVWNSLTQTTFEFVDPRDLKTPVAMYSYKTKKLVTSGILVADEVQEFEQVKMLVGHMYHRTLKYSAHRFWKRSLGSRAHDRVEFFDKVFLPTHCPDHHVFPQTTGLGPASLKAKEQQIVYQKLGKIIAIDNGAVWNSLTRYFSQHIAPIITYFQTFFC